MLEATTPQRQVKNTSKADQVTVIDVTAWHATRYFPKANDTLIGIVTMKNPEFFTLDINAQSNALLSTLEFQGATRKDKPKYEQGTLVYCKVILADRLAKTQLSCISALDKKAWNSGEAYFGELKGGFVRDFPIGFCQELLAGESSGGQETTTAIYLLNKLREKF